MSCTVFYSSLLIMLKFSRKIMQYYFEGRFDLVRFVKTVQEAGLFLHLRIGPYACAEWNYGYLLVTVSLLHNLKKMSIYF